MTLNSKYTFSFTGASALITETLVVAEEYERFRNWELVQKSLIENNLLNKVKEATFKREFSEIKKRLSLLTTEQLKIMIYGNLDDVKAIVLLSLSKAYPFFNDFILEVLRYKYFMFDNILNETDYIKFINMKSLSHSELNSLSELTAKKVKQRVFTLLEQVGLITNAKNGTIIKPILNKKVLDVIISENPKLLASFLYSDEEIKFLN